MADVSPLDPIRERLDADHAILRAAVERIPEEARSRRPHPDRWSAAEVIEHVAATERNIGGLLARFEAEAQPRDPSIVPQTSDEDLRNKLLDRSHLITAPGPIHPTGTMKAAAAMQALEDGRVQLFSAMERLAQRDLTTVSHPHRIFGPLNGYQWLLLIGGHEARHAAQIDEIADQLAADPA